MSETHHKCALADKHIDLLLTKITKIQDKQTSVESYDTSIFETNARKNSDTVGFGDLAQVLSHDSAFAWSEINSASQVITMLHSMLQSSATRVDSLERRVQYNEMKIRELSEKLEEASFQSTDGNYIWKITEVAQKRQFATSPNGSTSLNSPAFFSKNFGYKARMKLYFNGDGQGLNSHMSLFFVVCKGPYDGIQKWPFNLRIKFTLFDQSSEQSHIYETFRPDPQSASFFRPQTEVNVASGSPMFCSHAVLETKGYIIQDTMYIRCDMIEPSPS